MSRTELSYLDLAAFYMQAKNAWSEAANPMMHSTANFAYLAKELAEKLTCVIDAIRNDGLDPRWNPERDALSGIFISAGRCIGIGGNLDDIGAQSIIEQLHQRGYKIVKEA